MENLLYVQGVFGGVTENTMFLLSLPSLVSFNYSNFRCTVVGGRITLYQFFVPL